MRGPDGKHIFGTVKVGERGQIVIPKEAREVFGIRPGDTLLLLGDVERGIAMGMDESIGYSQTRRYLNPDADCSSFVFYALVHSGYTGLGSSPFYTGTMVNVMKNAGWQVLPFTSMDDLQPGDILWYRRTDIQGTHGHTEIYIGNGRMVGAHGDDGSIFESIGGDQTGKEVCEVAFHNPGWMTVLRYLQLSAKERNNLRQHCFEL